MHTKFAPLQNDRFLRALARQSVDRTPVWLMRQAGRYLPEYREVRKQVPDFMTLCQTPELACEVTLQPLRRFAFDASIVFSDILTIPAAMGMDLQFVKGEGPQFLSPLRTEKAIADLRIPEIENELSYVLETVNLVRYELQGKVPLIGFSGSPWTLATYMIEGSGSKTFSHVRAMRYRAPELVQQLLDKLTQTVADYLLHQIRVGAQAVMLFDSWGGLLSASDYQDISLRSMQAVVEMIRGHELGRDIPIILFSKGCGQHLEAMAALNVDGVGLDWMTSIKDARERIGDSVALQGNLDPCALYASPNDVKKHVKQVLADFGDGPGHIFNLGHGIYPDTPIESVDALLEAIQSTG